NVQGGEYGNALQAASSGGNKDIVELLLDKGADVNVRGGRYGNALQAALDEGNKDIVELLLDKGADVQCIEGSQDCIVQMESATKGAIDSIAGVWQFSDSIE
ncbi:hypothetical protein M378DRAFT_83919, partial [Amanita muscaria Koide BX008]